MQSQRLLPVTTVVFFIRFYVVGQVMSRELYSELWVCWIPALCTNCRVVCVSGMGEGGCRFCYNRNADYWVPCVALVYQLVSLFPHPCHLVCSLWEMARVSRKFQLISSFLPLSYFCGFKKPWIAISWVRHGEQLKSTVIFNRSWTRIWKDQVLLKRVIINSGLSPIASSSSPPSVG